MADRRWRRNAKNLLYNYPALVRQLKYGELDTILAQGNHRDNRYRRGGLSDPTALKALALDSQGRKYLEKQVQAGNSLIALYDTERRIDRNKLLLLRMVYFRFTHSLLGAAAMLGISERTAKRWNTEMLEHIAREMDWL